MRDRPILVIKAGGSVLSGPRAYQRVAKALADRICERRHERILAVVSAEAGVTDALLETAREAAGDPDPDTLDLLWSTGELRSVALLTFALHARGVRAVALNVAQTGLLHRSAACSDTAATREERDAILDRTVIRPLRLRALISEADVAVAPGFLARSPGDGVASLGRGGSDLSAVLLAAGLRAHTCELVKDVPGYFTEDPRLVPHASPIAHLEYDTAIAMARAGCGLVQLHALEAARDLDMPLFVRDLNGVGTVVRGSGFRVQGSGFRVQGSGFRVQGSGFRVQGSGFRVQGQAEGRESNDMQFSTRTIHLAQPAEEGTGALVAPIFQTSTFEQQAPGVHHGFDYSRTNNPTRERLESVLAGLEGVPHAAVFASGLAAVNAVLQAYLKPGDEVVVPLDVYGGTYRILTRVYEPAGCVVRQVDLGDSRALAGALTTRTRLVWIESPTNPRLLVYDIEAVSSAAHAAGALAVVDNTFATPAFQQPFELGADIVVHSVTKYLAGHSDLIQGAVLAKDAAVFEPVKFLQNATGAVPSPFDCWLTLRGVQTLELRVARHAENAKAIAAALTEHPLVRRVYFPGLPGHPGHDIARRQMTGFGGMVSFELDGTIDEVVSFVSSRTLFTLGESLGSVKSLICHPARMTHASIPAEARAALGLSDTLVRISPGCEHHRDLVADLLEGLETVRTSRAARLVVA